MAWEQPEAQTTEYRVGPPHWIEPINKGMDDVEMILRSISDDQHETLATATQNLLMAGGKRIRPAICLLTAGIFEAGYNPSVTLAAAVEMVHTATLVHDDLIDGSLLRRGKPTLNAELPHDAAVLMGDYLFARAADMVAEVEEVNIMKLFAKTLMVILNGEIAQRFTRWQADRQEYYKRIYAKTAALFVLAAKSVAMLGGAEDGQLTAVERFSHSLGMAFQIVDDVLDFTGDSGRMGKPNGSDFRQGLITLPLIYYLEENPKDAELFEILESQDREHEAIPRVIASVRESSAIDAALGEARDYAAHSLEELNKFPSTIYIETLSALANSVVERTA